MYWRLDKYLIDKSVTFVRRMFRYNTQWTNVDLEIVQFTSGSNQLVFEQYHEEAEKYPLISIATMGGPAVGAGFNDYLLSSETNTISLGERALSSVTISDTDILAVQLPVSVIGETIRGIDTYLAWTGDRVGGDNITVKLYSSYTTTPILVASGSIAGYTGTQFDTAYTELYPTSILSSTDYWLTYQTQSGSTYYIAIDNQDSLVTTYAFGGSTVTGSCVGGLVLPAFIRMGGNYQPSLSIRCSAKNNTQQVYDMTDLIMQYFVLAKHGDLSRTAIATDGMENTYINSNIIGEWTKSGFAITTIAKGPIDIRRRGENDIVFSQTVTVGIFTQWHQDYGALGLKEVVPIITTYGLDEVVPIITTYD